MSKDILKVKLEEIATIKGDKVNTELLCKSVKEKQNLIKSDKIVQK